MTTATNNAARKCPACGSTVGAATSVIKGDDSTPSPGDVTICFLCATAMMVRDDLTLEPIDLDTVTPAERANIERYQAKLREFRYAEGCEATLRAVKVWLETHPDQPIRIAMPPSEVAVIGDLQQLGRRIARSRSTLVFIEGVITAMERAHLDAPTVLMLQAALEHCGVPIERVSLAELGLVEADKRGAS